jgi:hypothetical protein
MALSESGLPQSTTITSVSTLSNPAPTIPTPATILPPFEASPITSPVLSPTKPPPPPASEAATNARRERKVLDLEISNSSLLAINRTLEREMRKQTTELRRFRRLSRSGRLSIRTISGTSKKASLGIVAEAGEDDDDDARKMLNGLEGMDLGDSDDDDDTASASGSSEADSTFSPTASGSASSNLSSGHALAQRRRDEKRLMLDLSKHRQLLIDSEKMNSSIRRCITWSDEMIREGRRALDYEVRVGGRVLEMESDSEEGGGGMGLVSPMREIGRVEVEGLWRRAEAEGVRNRERDAEKDEEAEAMSPIDSGAWRAEPGDEGKIVEGG